MPVVMSAKTWMRIVTVACVLNVLLCSGRVVDFRYSSHLGANTSCADTGHAKSRLLQRKLTSTEKMTFIPPCI